MLSSDAFKELKALNFLTKSFLSMIEINLYNIPEEGNLSLLKESFIYSFSDFEDIFTRFDKI
jgi:hypothetical protein